jgi:hypothetical protein
VKVKGIDLDLGVLARTHEADVAIRYHGLDLELALLRHQHQQSLRRGDHAADGRPSLVRGSSVAPAMSEQYAAA